MTFSYNTNLAEDRDWVRFKTGDTNEAAALLSDEEIGALLTTYADVTLTSAYAVEAILAKLARDVDRSNLGMSGTRSQKTQHYQDLLKTLRAQAGLSGEVFAGGQSIADKDDNAADTDLTQPMFDRGRHDNPGVR